MEKYLGAFSGNISEVEKGQTCDISFAKWYIRYSNTPISPDRYKEILAEDDQEKRKPMIDSLVKKLSEDSHETGFVGDGEEVMIGGFQNASFKIDDNELYYMFFNNIDRVKNILKQEGKLDTAPEGAIIYRAIRVTEEEYFGAQNASRKGRLNLLTPTFDPETDDLITPSIKVLKGKGMAECVELASVAHNLWTIAGIPSYYILSKDCHFDNISAEYSNDGHAFNLVNYGDSYKVYDKALGNFGRVEGDPISSLLNGEPVILKGNGVKTEGVYANYSQTLTEDTAQ